MSKKVNSSKPRKRYSPQFKSESLALAVRIGVSSAAKQLGLHESQLYSWRVKERMNQERSDVEQKLTLENTRLRRQLADQAEELAILKKAAAYFAKSLK